jgi:hypothetical protein
MIKGIDAETFERIYIHILNIKRGGLHNYLILVIVLESVGIFSVSAISRSPGRFYVGDIPWFRSKRAKESRRIECAGANFDIIRLLNDASLVCPVFF